MTTYEVVIWETQTLYNEEGIDPAVKLETYIEGAFDLISHDVITTVEDTFPYMYKNDENDTPHYYEQYVLDSGDKQYPCSSYPEATYDGITFYMTDWLRSCLDSDPGAWDIHILLTAAESGAGLTNIVDTSESAKGYAVSTVEGGPIILKAPDTFTRYEPRDDNSPEGKGIDAIQTAHHEMGHAFLHDDEFAHDDNQVGAVTKTDSSGEKYHWVTPLGLEGSKTENTCNESFNRPGDRRWDLLWSDCCRSKWESDLN